MDALNTFLQLISKTEGRDKVLPCIYSFLDYFNTPPYTQLSTSKRDQHSKYISR